MSSFNNRSFSTNAKYLSRPYGGRRHDFHLLKQEFSPALPRFENCTMKVDSGYTGIVNSYSYKSVSIPHKKSKNKPLTSEQKTANKQLALERIFVEHNIAGLKRFRIFQIGFVFTTLICMTKFSAFVLDCGILA
ncbi:transposase family protein [Thiospirillum jenense]|uniref:DDE Tnp4 domain-containing protein n=1 Tax=Thiospirillum jenense TaxID=1653858 RepID=A0A839HCJ6_9GAMM|nr:transposase family protein [Thiospirillum jenense]MBB1126381.1 hypothetical protein [Thiospirillum jenense]